MTSERSHCWHHDKIMLTSYPPQYPETCCRCGAKRTKRILVEDDPAHGPHGGPFLRQKETYTGGDGPCASGEVKS